MNAYIPPILGQRGFVDITCLSAHGLGVSNVYKVNRPGVGDWIVKRIEKEYATLYKAEKTILTTLRHDFLPIIFDIFEDAQALYIAMEFIPGKSLQDLMDGEAIISETAAQRYFVQLCELFEYLHSKNVIHKDCKPSNIMLSSHNNIYLIDFGISKSPIHNPSGQSHGYTPPEQILAPETVDNRADIYALGATMYSLLTKEVPNKPTQSHITAKLNTRTDISLKFRQVILKCMAQKPSGRYQSMADVKKAILTKNWIWKTAIAMVLMLVFSVVTFFGTRIWAEETVDRLITVGDRLLAEGDYQAALYRYETYITRRPLSSTGFQRRRNALLHQGYFLVSLDMANDIEQALFHSFLEDAQYSATWAGAVNGGVNTFYAQQDWHHLTTLLAVEKVQSTLGYYLYPLLQHVHERIATYYTVLGYTHYTANQFTECVALLNGALEAYPALFDHFPLLHLRAAAMLSDILWDNTGDFDRFVIYAQEAIAAAGEDDQPLVLELLTTLDTLGRR